MPTLSRAVLTWFFAGLAGVSAAVQPASPSVLHWNTGDTLPGELVGATADQVTWRSPLFEEPVVIARSALQSVAGDIVLVPPRETFRVRLRDGSCVYGMLTGLEEGRLHLHSERHGDLALNLKAVLEVQRLKGGSVLYAGPTGLSGWSDSNDIRKTTVPKGPQSSALAVSLWDESLFLALPLPDRVEMEFRVQATDRPDFELILAPLSPADKSPRLEMWNDELVVVNVVGEHGIDFASIAKLDKGCHEVALRVFLNRTAGRIMVSDPQGKVLGDWKTAPMTGAFSGITLRNKGWDLSLESLRVRQWNGESPRQWNSEAGRVELTDERILAGGIAQGSQEGFVPSGTQEGTPDELPWSQLEAWVLPPQAGVSEEPAANAKDGEIWFADGDRIRGAITALHDGMIYQTTSFSDQPVTSRVEGVRLIQFHSPPKKGEKPEAPALADEMTVDKAKYRGEWVRTGDGALHWRLPGAVEAAKLSPGHTVKISPQISGTNAALHSQALLYLADNDVLSGRLLDMDRDHLNFESDFAAASVISCDKVHALHFQRATPQLSGFLDPGWRIMKGEDRLVQRSTDWVCIQAGGAFGHPAIMMGDEINFTLESNRGGSAKIRLYSEGTNLESRTTNLEIGVFGTTVYFGLEGSGVTENLQQAGTGNTEGSADIRLVFQEEQMELFVNGTLVRTYPLPQEERSGGGLIFEPGAMWGNQQRPIVISGFSVHGGPGAIVPPAVMNGAKPVALLIPRFLKESPPRQILVADNGDLLRGEIDAATTTDFAFRSGMETIRLPRERIAAMIWPRKVEEKSSALSSETPPVVSPDTSTFQATHWLSLINGARLAMKVRQMTADSLIGVCQGLGECRVPANLVRTLRTTEQGLDLSAHFFADWQFQRAPEPVVAADGGQESPLVGKEAEKFALPLLEGGAFALAEETGKVVVLDFWATWCGPCLKSMPDMIAAMSAFPPEKVRFVGINQAESSEVIQRFLESRGWKLTTALDANQNIARKYGVEGIPHTVVIGPDGRVAWVKSGYSPDGARSVAEVVKSLIGSPAATE